MSGETLQVVIQQAIKAQILELHTCLPARVEKYDHLTQKADVKPLIKRKLRKDQSLIEFPVIPSVPVQHPCGGGAFIHLPISVGDTGIVVIAERSIDAFLSGTGQVADPKDTRHHNLSDAIFIPGVKPFANAVAGTNNSVIIGYGNTTVEIFNNGKVKIYDGSENLTDLIKQLCEACESITTLTSIGPQPVINKGTFTALKTKIGAFV